MAIVLDGTAGITTPDLTDTSLTSGRVVYAGTSGNLTGSSSLVFDGTNLGIGTSSPTTKLTISGTSAIITTDGTTNTGARGLDFVHSGQSYGSLLNYAQTGETALTAGFTSSSGYFLTFKTNNTERARIDSAGRVTMPYQSGFAYGSSEVTVVGSNYILFSGGSYNYNVGSILNLTGGTSGSSRVTVPVSGYYSVNVSIMGSTDGTRIEMFVTKNGTNIFGTNSISSQYNNAQINGVFYFAANDYLEIYKQAGSIYGSNSPNNFFTVRLLG